ncbi:hypothetical protein J6590_021073 [Homalodisca vitripennis]|nr:hypothetical protein J6590_021073 [Homalodisca vitripennis]
MAPSIQLIPAAESSVARHITSHVNPKNAGDEEFQNEPLNRFETRDTYEKENWPPQFIIKCTNECTMMFPARSLCAGRFKSFMSVTETLFIGKIDLVLYRVPLLFCLKRSSHRRVANEDRIRLKRGSASP